MSLEEWTIPSTLWNVAIFIAGGVIYWFFGEGIVGTIKKWCTDGNRNRKFVCHKAKIIRERPTDEAVAKVLDLDETQVFMPSVCFLASEAGVEWYHLAFFKSVDSLARDPGRFIKADHSKGEFEKIRVRETEQGLEVTYRVKSSVNFRVYGDSDIIGLHLVHGPSGKVFRVIDVLFCGDSSGWGRNGWREIVAQEMVYSEVDQERAMEQFGMVPKCNVWNKMLMLFNRRRNCICDRKNRPIVQTLWG